MPSKLYQFIADFVLSVFKPAFKKDLKKIAVNTKAIFGLESHSNFVKVFQKQVMIHQIVSNLEIIKGLANPKAKITVLDLDVLKKNLESVDNENIVCITGHIGSWELCAKSVADASNQTFFTLSLNLLKIKQS